MKEHQNSRHLSVSIEDGLAWSLCNVDDPRKPLNGEIRGVHVDASVLRDNGNPDKVGLCLGKHLDFDILDVAANPLVELSAKILCSV